jgi:LAS superfamily LD-carboxypeptidase LdcB
MASSFARRRMLAAATAMAALMAGSVVTSAPTGAQEIPSESGQPHADEQALVSIAVDVLRGDSSSIGATLVEVRENVETQKATLATAQAAVITAENALATIDAALADTRARLADLTIKADRVVIDAFMNPPMETALEALSSDNLSDATVKQSILNRQADGDAALLDQYEALEEQLTAQQAEQETAARTAATAKADAEAALADVEAAVGQEVTFALEVERRLEQRLAEAEALENVDPALAEQIRAREAELAAALNALDEEVRAEQARQLAAQLSVQAQENRDVTGIKPVPGGVVDVTCPAGGSVQVAGDIASSVERLMADAFEAGVTMCGSGYRDPADQIALRQANCGSSDYAIYQAPSSYCSPPTARPGASLHEQGLAIDFTYGSGSSTISSGSAVYSWLQDHAADYGLYNLPGEPWHWSVDGN